MFDMAKSIELFNANKTQCTVSYCILSRCINLVSCLWDIGKQCRSRSDATSWWGSSLFAYSCKWSIKIWKKWKIPPNTPKIRNVLVLLIRVGKSIWLKWVNLYYAVLLTSTVVLSCCTFSRSIANGVRAGNTLEFPGIILVGSPLT